MNAVYENSKVLEAAVEQLNSTERVKFYCALAASFSVTASQEMFAETVRIATQASVLMSSLEPHRGAVN